MKLHVLPATLLAALIGLVAPSRAVATITPPVALGDLDRNQFPLYEWWQNTQWVDPTPNNWTTLNITNWTTDTTKIAQPGDPNVDVAAVINKIITTTTGSTIIYLPAGDYWAHSAVSLSRDNVRLQGASRSGTRLIFTGQNGDATINIRGTVNNTTGLTVSPAPQAGQNQITVVGTHAALTVGAHVYVTQSNWGKIARVTGISGSTVTLDRAFTIGFTDPVANPIKVDIITAPRSNCGVESLSFVRADTATSTKANFNVEYATNIRISSVESSGTLYAHVGLFRVQDSVIANSVFHHSSHYGVGGSGYGIQFGGSTTRVRVGGNAFYNLRHAIVFSKSNFNVVHNNYMRSDQGSKDERYHGDYPYANLFENNDVIGLYADNTGANGPYNANFRNRGLMVRSSLGGGSAAEAPFVTVGNVVTDSATGTYAGANIVGGVMQWGALTSTSVIPNSLFRANATATDTPFGPGRTNYGAGVELAGQAWVPSVYRGAPADTVDVNLTQSITAPVGGPGFALWPSSVPAAAYYVASASTAGSSGGPVNVSARYLPGLSTDNTDDRLYLLLSNPTGFRRRVDLNYTQVAAFYSMVRCDMYVGTRSAANASSGWITGLPVIKTDMTTDSDLILDQALVLDANTTLYLEMRRNDDRKNR